MLSSKKFILRYVLLKILNNEYSEGMPIPSENRLAIKFNCTRLTARSALITLVNVGILKSKQGMGYLISENALNILFNALKLQRSASNSKIEEIQDINVDDFKKLSIENYTNVFFIKNFDKKKNLSSVIYLFLNKDAINKAYEKNISFGSNPIEDLIDLAIVPNVVETNFTNFNLSKNSTELESLGHGSNVSVPIIYQEWQNNFGEWIVKTISVSKNDKILFSNNIKL